MLAAYPPEPPLFVVLHSNDRRHFYDVNLSISHDFQASLADLYYRLVAHGSKTGDYDETEDH